MKDLKSIVSQEYFMSIYSKLIDEEKPRVHLQNRYISNCQADCDGYCEYEGCPQLRDNEPIKTGRHCPLDVCEDDLV